MSTLGIDTARLGATTVETLTLAVGGKAADAHLPFRAGGLSRLCLDEALVAEAARAGAEIIRGQTVTGLEASEGSVPATTDAASQRVLG